MDACDNRHTCADGPEVVINLRVLYKFIHTRRSIQLFLYFLRLILTLDIRSDPWLKPLMVVLTS